MEEACEGTREKATNAVSKRGAIGGHGQSRRGAPFFHQGKGASKLLGAATNGDGRIIATVFTFCADALAEPPDGGMVEEQRFRGDLEKIHESVMTADVREFVRKNGGELGFAEAGERGDGQKDRMTDRFYTVVGHSGLPQLTNKLIRHITCCTGGDV